MLIVLHVMFVSQDVPYYCTCSINPRRGVAECKFAESLGLGGRLCSLVCTDVRDRSDVQ